VLIKHNVPQFSRQQLTAFRSSFDFPDRLNILDCLERQKKGSHKSGVAISEAASMLLVTSIFSAILIISAKVNPFRDMFHDSGPIWHQ
jgi:hypothetical protein